MDEGEEVDNTREIAEAVFSQSCQKPCSIMLQFDEDNKDELFEIMTLIMMHGIRIKYGDIDILQLTHDQLFEIGCYMRSMGVNPVLEYGFVQVDENGVEISEPKYYTVYISDPDCKFIGYKIRYEPVYLT